MFVRTPRLTLRPGWPEDAPALHAAIAHESVIRNLSGPPWPYRLEDAVAELSVPHAPAQLRMLIFRHDGRRVSLIGGVGIGPVEDEPMAFGCWLAPSAWGRGYATEAGRAALDCARMLGIRHVTAAHPADNPASGRVLRRLGFRPVGRSERYSRGRGRTVACIELAIDPGAPNLSAGPDDVPMAA